VVRVKELMLNEIDDIVDRDQVPDLLALPAVSEVGQLPAEVMAQHPMREDALVDLAHLPGAGNDAAAVDNRHEPEGGGVFGDQQLGGQLRRSVERSGAIQRKALRDSPLRNAFERLLGLELEARLLFSVVEPVLLFDGVDPARRQEDQLPAAFSGVLQAVVCA
jgi:hypothetical protein